MATEEGDSDLHQQATGVTHVGLLRAGAARHVVAALADGQVLMYRENGEETWSYTCIFNVKHNVVSTLFHMFLVSVSSGNCH